jgi:DNA-binding response OmpR family regulator
VKKRIFICDTDHELVGALLSFLSDKYELASGRPDESSLAVIEKFDPDVILVSSEPTPATGLHPFREISQAGMIFLCPRLNVAIENKIFEMGGDHFLEKPFQLDQLEHRIQSLLRLREQAGVRNPSIRLGNLEIQPLDRTVKVRGAVVPLSPLHFELLLAFARHPERLLSRAWLRQHIWHNKARVSLRTVDAHISKLKKEIPELERLIFNVYGEGYMLSQLRRSA